MLLFFAMIFLSLEQGKRSLLTSATQNSAMIADSILMKTAHNIQKRLDEFSWYGLDSDLQQALLVSNTHFAALADHDRYIAERDEEWRQTPLQTSTPLMTEITTSALSHDLRRKFFTFFELNYGYLGFSEIFVTNSYGVNIAQTNRTSDYLQADEEWWQRARKDGQYLGGVEYDESSGIQGLTIAVRLDDHNGDFLGVIKGVLPLQSLIRTAEIVTREYQTTEIQMITDAGILLYSSKVAQLGKNIAAEPYFLKIKEDSGYFIDQNSSGRSRLFTYIRSEGLLNSKQLNWIVMISHDPEEILTHSILFEKKILLGGIAAILLATIIAFYTARIIANPLTRLKQAAASIANGNLECQIKQASRDEIGDLAQTFNDMAVSLSESYQKMHLEIEERKKAETALAVHAQELAVIGDDLARRNSELDEFTYVASHDLQEPLRKLTSFSGLLVKDAGDALPENARKDLNFIIDAATRMQALIQDLLALSRSGRKEMTNLPISLDLCVDDALYALAVRIEEIDAVIRRDSLPQVIGDKTMLTQLYQNLIGNALKFTGEQRPLIHLSAEIHGEKVVLGVRDNGIGIKAEYCDRIFLPFKRLHGMAEYPGSGIGLAICRKVVERHGSEILVESEPGQGTLFSFTLTRAS